MEPTRGKKLTKEMVNEQLLRDNRDIRLIGEYVNNKVKTLFQCDQGHQWTTTYGSIQQGRNCPKCHTISVTLTKEQINERLRIDGRGIQLIGEYVNNGLKTLFQCDQGHQWMTTCGNIIGNGCPSCAKRPHLTKETINERLRIDDRGIKLIGEYVNNRTKSLFQCAQGHQWMARYDHIHKGSGCSICCPRGFNENKPAWRYVLQFNNRDKPFIKFGITNNIKSRLTEHRKCNGDFDVMWTHQDDSGHVTLEWERNIKTTHGGRYVTKDECPDGFTETLSPSLLSEIIGEQL